MESFGHSDSETEIPMIPTRCSLNTVGWHLARSIWRRCLSVCFWTQASKAACCPLSPRVTFKVYNDLHISRWSWNLGSVTSSVLLHPLSLLTCLEVCCAVCGFHVLGLESFVKELLPEKTIWDNTPSWRVSGCTEVPEFGNASECADSSWLSVCLLCGAGGTGLGRGPGLPAAASPKEKAKTTPGWICVAESLSLFSCEVRIFQQQMDDG